MNVKTYIDKSNTITYNSTINTSQNPVCELYYGDGFSKFLFHFDLTNIQSLINDKTFVDYSQLKHVLKIKNAWGLEKTNYQTIKTKERLSGFNLYLLRITEEWTEGSGRDKVNDIYNTNTRIISTDASNWFNASTESEWTIPMSGLTSDNSTYLVGQQTFSRGDEDVEIDITSEINLIISGSVQNYGYLLCLEKQLEDTSLTIPSYVSLITNKTTSLYKPYLETTIDNEINDDRYEFYLGKKNRLYFYSIIGGEFKNLDTIPTCTINNTGQTVYQQTKGVYYIETTLSQNDYEPETILYDIWSNITYSGNTFNDVEMQFVTLSTNNYFKFGTEKLTNETYVPTIFGINIGEKINIGEIRKIFIQPRISYTTNNIKNIDGIEYRLYVKNGSDDITIIEYEKVNRMPEANYFIIDSNYLQPEKYFVDIKIKRNGEDKIYKEKLMFEII